MFSCIMSVICTGKILNYIYSFANSCTVCSFVDHEASIKASCKVECTTPGSTGLTIGRSVKHSVR